MALELGKKLTLVFLAFSAGALGGVINFCMPLIFGKLLHITTALGVNIAGSWSKATLYHDVFWGGLWGFALLLDVTQLLPQRVNHRLVTATLYGLLPSLAQLLIVFPTSGQGIGGLELGALTPLFVLLFNTLGWSWPAYWSFLQVEGSAADAPSYSRLGQLPT